ncbi:Solute carrier family 35 member F1 [Gryllus bimaculatus]|nr:Solute carrier family 35 member F1 [Gryllus bimaculatus]
MEIDTSSVSCDWISVPQCDPPCSGSYQPLPPENIDNNIHEEVGLMNFLIFARPVWRAIILGQVMSFLICSMALCSYYINSVYQVAMPTGQSFIHYGMLCLVYTTWLACRTGERGLLSVIRNRGWRYVLIAVADVEANTLVTTAYQFTTLTSIQVQESEKRKLSINLYYYYNKSGDDAIDLMVQLYSTKRGTRRWPLSLFYTLGYLGYCSTEQLHALSSTKVRYKMVHIIGIGVCLMGVGCLVWADIEDGRPIIGGKTRLLGDMLCLVGALLFAMIAVAQEFVAKTFDGIEYLGMLGLFGSILNGLQLAFLEKSVIYEMKWDTFPVLWLFCGFGVAQFVFHSIAPVVLRDSGATALQLSLLTSDFYCVLGGILLLHYKVHVLYFVSFSLTMVGVLIYAIKRTPITTQQPASYRT